MLGATGVSSERLLNEENCFIFFDFLMVMLKSNWFVDGNTFTPYWVGMLEIPSHSNRGDLPGGGQKIPSS
jgi:hypothetical protein